jgi:hypothetical protein
MGPAPDPGCPGRLPAAPPGCRHCLAEIGGGSEIDMTVPAQLHDRLRCVPIDSRAGGGELLEQGHSRDDAAVGGPLALLSAGNCDGVSSRPCGWGRSRPAPVPADRVGGPVTTLPLRHVGRKTFRASTAMVQPLPWFAGRRSGPCREGNPWSSQGRLRGKTRCSADQLKAPSFLQ